MLAVAQTDWVISQLSALNPGVEFSKTIIQTAGDGGDLQLIGAWVSALEEALLSGEVDLAVHSLKDVPTQMPPGLALAAIPAREDPRDVLISANGESFGELKEGAVIGTSSQRRGFQLLQKRPDLKIVPIRGNIQTRIAKMRSGEADAILLALAGLKRGGLENEATEILSLQTMLPAVGQAALGIQTRSGDTETIAICRGLNDEPTEICVKAERAFLAGTGGGCRQPMAAFAELKNDRLMLQALYFTSDGKTVGIQDAIGPKDEPEELGRWMARHVLHLTSAHVR